MIADDLRKIHLAYKNMRSRCYDPKNASYKHYGARGIAVCEEWLNSRDSFVSWAISTGHDMGLSLDRIDNELGYSPDNCRWVDSRTQLLNQRRARLVTHGGATKNLSVWAEELGVETTVLYRRLFVYNMSVEKALSAASLRQWRHGTRQGYEYHKCRCEACRSAHAQRHRTVRANKKAAAGLEGKAR